MNSKTYQYYENDHILLLAGYHPPKEHKHLALHILISSFEKIHCKINDDDVDAHIIIIDSDVSHAPSYTHPIYTFLFDETSVSSNEIKKRYLQGKAYALLDKELENKILSIDVDDLKEYDYQVMQVLQLHMIHMPSIDNRIKEVLQLIQIKDIIDKETIKELSNQTCLSQSRLSHLFKAHTGIALNRYLVIMRVKKTYEYYNQGYNITDSCMMAGFDSPSHFAYTCKKMFGISFSDFSKTIE